MKKRYEVSGRKIFILIAVFFTLFIALSMMLSLGSHFVSGEDEYDTAHPRIEVIYDELPVTIINYSLINTNLATPRRAIPLTPQNNAMLFNFSTEYLDNNEYNFSIYALDTDGNENYAEKLFTINHPGMPVWLISPPAGIGQTRTYTITIGSRFESTCKWGTTIDNGCQNISCRYNSLPHFFDQTGNSLNHSTQYTSPQAPGVYLEFYFICKITNSVDDNEINYGGNSSKSGYENRPVHITSITSDQNPIVDKYNRRDLIDVITDLPAVCQITGANGFGMPPTSSMFDNEDNRVPSSYATNHTFTLDLTQVSQQYNDLQFGYKIKCFGYSQLTDEKDYTVSYSLNKTIMITRITPEYVTDRNTPFDVKTNIIVQYCTASLNGKSLGQMDTTGTTHTVQLPNINLGSNTVEITCVQEGSTTTTSFPLGVDDVNPYVDLQGHDNSCGLTALTFTIFGNDTGSSIKTYHYSITGPQGLLVDKNITSPGTITENLALISGEQYTITVEAFDMAGNPSETATKTVTANAANTPVCDFIPPTMNINVLYIGQYHYQANVSVTCTDDVSCDTYFKYYFENYSNQCNYSRADQQATYAEGLPILDPDTIGANKTNICVVVLDQNGNAANGSAQIILTRRECHNGILEDGEDCEDNNLNGIQCSNLTIIDDANPFKGQKFVGGTLKCTECSFDISNCNAWAGYCGDNKVNNFPNEECDGNSAGKDWGKITSCQDLGFTGGTLSCNLPYTTNQCHFNTAGCTDSNPLAPNCTGSTSSVKVFLDAGEECEPQLTPFNLSCTSFDSFVGGTLQCTDECKYDISSCIVPPTCGNGKVEGGESCDDNAIIDCTAVNDTMYSGGNASCNTPGSINQCQFNVSRCEAKPYCGNGNIETGEVCDSSALAGFTCNDFKSTQFPAGYPNGTLSCSPDCQSFNIDNCNKGAGYCGDKIINNFPNEQCDGNSAGKDWGKITNCKDFGFASGTLSCSTGCQFNTSGCIANKTNPAPSCGGGALSILDKGEQCEEGIPFALGCTKFDSFVGGDLSCSACNYDISQCQAPTPPAHCGDGVLPAAGKDCEGEGNQTLCTDIGDMYKAGNATCRSCKYDVSKCEINPTCGNGIREPGELCDKKDLAGFTCNDFGNPKYTKGILQCDESCKFNIDNCDKGAGFCGDNKTNNFPNEQCDGNGAGKDWGKITNCKDFGFASGTLRCDNCMFNTTGCIANKTNPAPSCGGGALSILDPSEQCEDGLIFTLGCTKFDSFVGGDLSCSACNYDISQCQAPTPPAHCGDGVLPAAGKDCEGEGNQTPCTDIGDVYSGGNATCHNCKYDVSYCKFHPFCGNNVTDDGEQCDGTSLKAFNGQVISCSNFGLKNGQLTCDKGCNWDTTNCNDGVHGWCGDNKIQDPNSGGLIEQCDGNGAGKDWGKITSCQNFGFAGGSLSCNRGCQFNTSGCTQTNPNPNPSCSGSGNTLDSGEQCEPTRSMLNCSWFDSFSSGEISCDECMYNIARCVGPAPPSVCGDGIVEPGETCDGNESRDCTEFPGYSGGTASCYPKGNSKQCKYDFSQCIPVPECGNNNVEGTEQCDGTSVGGMNCTSIDSFKGGILRCMAKGPVDECTWDVSKCDLGIGYCGDNIINNFPNEECDGTDWGHISKQQNTGCQDLGFTGGTLRCNGCMFNTSGCTDTSPGQGSCGDKVLDSGESCEPTIPLAVNCTNLDHFIGGDLACTSDCAFDISGCQKPQVPVCGDGYIQGNEQCDGDSLGKTTDCTQVGNRFSGGTLTCGSDCKYNITQCDLKQPSCGNGVREKGEMCDGTNFGEMTCQSFELGGGPLVCDSNCQVDTTNCESNGTSEKVCGDNAIQPGEMCDGTNLASTNWNDVWGCTGTVSCGSDCKLQCSTEDYTTTSTCDNNIMDGDETDTNCGGSCPACEEGKSCINNNDCSTGNCADNICAAATTTGTSCSVDTDCASGVCNPDGKCQEVPSSSCANDSECGASEKCVSGSCQTQSSCITDSDCSAGKCVEGTCTVSKSGTGMIILFIGLILSLASGGYLIYRTYFDKSIKPRHSGLPPPVFQSSQPSQSKAEATDTKLTELQQQKLAERREQKVGERKAILKGFENQLKNVDDISKIPEKKSEQDFIDINDLHKAKADSKNVKPEKNDVFSKLAQIAGFKGDKPSDMQGGTTSASTAKEPGAIATATAASKSPLTSPNENLIEKAKTDKASKTSDKGEKTIGGQKRSKKQTQVSKEVFNKLDKMSQKYSPEEMSRKISELSGKAENKVSDVLSYDKLSNKQATSLFEDLDRDKLTSDVFKEILFNLIITGKLSKESVSGMLFEYMDKGQLSKKDIAKIMSDLKLI